jgi:hypothetical protein
MVNIALGNPDFASCSAGDANGDHQITVDEILAAVNNALNGCPRQTVTRLLPWPGGCWKGPSLAALNEQSSRSAAVLAIDFAGGVN